MNWDHVVRHIQHDPRYQIIPKISEKKRIFNEWKTQQDKDERVSANAAI